MINHPKKTKDFRFLFLLMFCAVSGAVLNGSAAFAESTRCSQSEHPTTQCLTQSPVIQTIQGAFTGIVVGSAAAVGAVWRQHF